MNSRYFYSAEFVVCWILLVFQPFFPESGGFLLVANCLVVLFAFDSLNKILDSTLLKNKLIKIALLCITLAGFIVSFLALMLEKPFLYSNWSKLGAGSMSLDGSLYIFGDLAHLTSAAKCSKHLVIGTNVCDPWGRELNQNPEVIEFFRFCNLTNVRAIGFVTVILLFLLLGISLRKLKIDSIAVFLMISTPVMLLAIDRGNEIITLSLLLVGILALDTKSTKWQAVCGVALALAALFKLWPVVLIFFVLFFCWNRITWQAKAILISPIFYWAFRLDEIRALLGATQQGSLAGLSFGFKLLAFTEMSWLHRVTLFVLSLIFFLMLLNFTKFHLVLLIEGTCGVSILRKISPYMMTYSLLWIIGDSFVYRMIMLLPIVIYLGREEVSQFQWPRMIQSAIIVTSLSSKTPAILISSSALSLYFIFIFFTVGKRIWPKFKSINSNKRSSKN